MTEEPRDYDREFTTPLEYRVRRRIGYSHDHGVVTRFVVQMEYGSMAIGAKSSASTTIRRATTATT